MTRLYTPKDYGHFGLMLSIAGILQILGTFRFDLAVKRATTVELAKFNYFISLGGVLFTSLIALVAIAWISCFESTLLSSKFGIYFYLLPLLVFLIGFWQVTAAFLTREGLFNRKGITELSQSVSAILINIVGGLLGWGNLVLGGVLSRITSILIFVRKIQYKESFFGFVKCVSVKKISNQFKANKDLLKYSVPSALLYRINSNLPIFYLANYLDSALVGFFVLTNRVILAPVSLLGTSVGDVFQNRIRKKIENKNELLKVLARVWMISFIVILPVSLCLFLFGPQMFGLLFGEKWQTSGYIASALAVSLSFKFMGSITNGTFTMLKLESVGFYCSVFELPSKILIFVFFDQKNELINSFWAIAIYDAIQIVFVNILLLFKINKKRV